ncbi:hypothetical protein, partial [Halothiobacillus sp.]|uniref:hypothetical protein n=1 Tax=Halothiobacillus sp. TaxID=1891311 RepID=UPI0026212687
QYVLRRAAAFQKLVEQGIGLLLGNGHWFSSFSLVADNQLHSYLYTLVSSFSQGAGGFIARLFSSSPGIPSR